MTTTRDSVIGASLIRSIADKPLACSASFPKDCNGTTLIKLGHALKEENILLNKISKHLVSTS